MSNKRIFSSLSCWTITDGTAGTVTQSMGLAEMVGFKSITPKIFKSKISFPFFPSLMHLWAKVLMTKESDALEAPWPNCAIGCGRRIIPFLRYIKQKSPKTFCIYIMDPKISSKYFDLVIKLPHDSIEGSNVITTPISLNRINKAKLQTDAKKFGSLFKKYPKPYYTILIGGNTKSYQMDSKAIDSLMKQIETIAKTCKVSLLITPSRRTSPALLKALKDKQNKRLYVADIETQNPYFAMLALAQKIFVTNDSVNMISESYATGKDVQILPLLGLKKAKSLKFLEALNKIKPTKISNNNVADLVRKALLNFNKTLN